MSPTSAPPFSENGLGKPQKTERLPFASKGLVWIHKETTIIMATTVKLPDTLVNEARRFGSIYSRSTPKQIEYWMRIGKIAEENPDLPYHFIKAILLAQAEVKEEEVTPYQFG